MKYLIACIALICVSTYLTTRLSFTYDAIRYEQESVEVQMQNEPVEPLSVLPPMAEATTEETTAYVKSVQPTKRITRQTEEATTKEPETYYWNVPLSHSLQDYIRKQCDKYDIPMELVLAIIKHESNYNPNEVSPSRDYGLMQIHDGSFGYLEKQFGELDYLKPKDNIKAGVYILWLHIQRADGDLLKGVMAYNKGDAGMRALWESGVHSTHYTERVFYYYELYLAERLANE